MSKTREEIENELGKELGWRWTPQMRHGFKMKKLWERLVNARLELAGAEPMQLRGNGHFVDDGEDHPFD